MAEPLLTGGTFVAAIGAILAVGYQKRKVEEASEGVRRLDEEKVDRNEFKMLERSVENVHSDVREILRRLS